jgi:hypothetical protein
MVRSFHAHHVSDGFTLTVCVFDAPYLFTTKNLSHKLGYNGVLFRNGCFEGDKTKGDICFRFRYHLAILQYFYLERPIFGKFPEIAEDHDTLSFVFPGDNPLCINRFRKCLGPYNRIMTPEFNPFCAAYLDREIRTCVLQETAAGEK